MSSETQIEKYSELSVMRRNVALSGFSALRVGGNADLFFEPAKPEHFSALLSALQEDNRDYFILGGGANVCLPDEGLRIVIHTGAMRRMFREDDCIRVWPGVTIQQLVRAAGELGLSGMQKLVGVPGNLGGAIAMNAGSAEWGIWELVEEVTLWTAEGLGAFTPAEIQPEYRNGNLGERVLLEALLRFTPRPVAEIKSEQEDFLRRKNKTQPVTLSSAGCAFVNPDGNSAGRLIEEAGLKGFRIGGIEVSTRHANFLVNDGSACAADVVAMLTHIEAEVLASSGIQLQRELVVVGSQ